VANIDGLHHVTAIAANRKPTSTSIQVFLGFAS
jgi:hypothetical protein